MSDNRYEVNDDFGSQGIEYNDYDPNKYQVNDDFQVNNAGFSNRSRYDLEREKLIREIDRYSDKSGQEPLLLILTLVAGLHRLTNGKIFSGLLFGVTLGGCGLWLIADWIKILSGKFTDKYGKPICARAVYGLQQQLDLLEKRHANGEF